MQRAPPVPDDRRFRRLDLAGQRGALRPVRRVERGEGSIVVAVRFANEAEREAGVDARLHGRGLRGVRDLRGLGGCD